jgi:regulatory protein
MKGLRPDVDLNACYLAAMRILNHRFNSEAELRRKLALKEFDADVIGATIEKLRREKWLDDDRFSASFVRARTRKGLGRHRITRELSAAGVESEAITRALDVPDHDERAAALTSARKRLTVLRRRNDDDSKIREKLVAYLFRQGYDSSLAIDVVRELMT